MTSKTFVKRMLWVMVIVSVASVCIIYFLMPDKNKETPPANSERSLERLLEGNARFVKNEMQHPDESKERRVELSTAQHPFAVVVSCSDSRVPPELIFDQGLGDLFVIRTAGNLVDSLELGSIEYAVEHLGVKLLVVLGHENCGVIKAFLEKKTEHNHITKLLTEVAEEPEEKVAVTEKGDLTDNCVRANIKHITLLLKNSEPVLAEKFRAGELKIVGAHYDLDKGEVEMIE